MVQTHTAIWKKKLSHFVLLVDWHPYYGL
jgi:hypothetical protein